MKLLNYSLIDILMLLLHNLYDCGFNAESAAAEEAKIIRLSCSEFLSQPCANNLMGM